jgi:hypothetical protein
MLCCNLKYVDLRLVASGLRPKFRSTPGLYIFWLIYIRLRIGLKEQGFFCVMFAGGNISLSTSHFKAVGLVLNW